MPGWILYKNTSSNITANPRDVLVFKVASVEASDTKDSEMNNRHNIERSCQGGTEGHHGCCSSAIVLAPNLAS